MALMPVVVIGDGAVVLALDVVDATRTVVGWSITNSTGAPVTIVVTSGAFRVQQELAPGTHTGNVPKNRQWSLDADVATEYGLTARI